MPTLNEVIALVLGIIDYFGGKVIVAAAMTITIAVLALTYIADKVFQK